jgi:hypothetical protein
MQALPFLLKNFITEEVGIINQKIKENQVPLEPVEDPSDAIQMVVNAFKDWYNLLRQPILTSKDFQELAKKTYYIQKLCMLIFPDKSGIRSMCLNMIQHMSKHTCFIDCFGWFSNRTISGVEFH